MALPASASDYGCECTCPCGCTLTVGYWKNHPDAWRVDALTLGNVGYWPKDELLQILDQPANGNGLVSLAQQLIAARLNQERFLEYCPLPSEVYSAMADADALIGWQIVPPFTGAGYMPPSETSALVDALTAFNEGVLPGWPACPD